MPTFEEWKSPAAVSFEEWRKTSNQPEPDLETDLPMDTGVEVPKVNPVSKEQPYMPPSWGYQKEKPVEEDWGTDFQSSEEPMNTSEFLQSKPHMDAIRKYMIDRRGVQWENRSDEEVLDKFMSHMRWVMGNEISTVGEARYITMADDEKRANAATAYQAIEDMSSMFTNGDLLEGAWDYLGATIGAPSTYAGAGVGKLGVALGSKALLKQAVKSGGVAAARRVIKQQAAQSAKKKLLKEGAIAFAVDTGLAGMNDHMLQTDVFMASGAQDKFNNAEFAISSLLGGAGALAAVAIPYAKASKLNPEQLAVQKKIRVATANQRAAPKVKQSLTKLANKWSAQTIDWDSIKNGGSADKVQLGVVNDITKWFFDVNDPESLVNTIVDSGAKFKSFDDETITAQIGGFARSLGQQNLNDFNNIVQPAFGIKFGEFIDIAMNAMSQTGSIQNYASVARRFVDSASSLRSANKRASASIVSAGPPKESPQMSDYIRYTTSLWRRALVSHPATSAINVLGWGQSTTARSLSEIINAGYYGVKGLGTANGMTLGKSRDLLANQIFKLQTLMDPYATRDSFKQLLEEAPNSIKDKVFKDYFGGVGHVDIAEAFHMPMDSKTIKILEGASETAANISLVKLQDSYTKTFTGAASLDRLSRAKFGKGLSKLLEDGEYHKITPEMWEVTMRDMLEDTFSVDYTKGRGVLNKSAKLVEDISNMPMVGFLFPFGRFMNNNMAFTMKYSPLGFINVGAKFARKGATSEELLDATSKAMVGSLALAAMYNFSQDNREEGFSMHEVEDHTGRVRDYTNIAPISFTMSIGSLLDRLMAGEGVPEGTIEELFNQTGFSTYGRQLGEGNIISELLRDLERSSNTGDTQTLDLVRTAVKFLSGDIASGFTRPLDPLNQIADQYNIGNPAKTDRRQADSVASTLAVELTRYTDNLFEFLLDDGTIGVPARDVSRPEGDIINPNPFSGLVGSKEKPPRNYTDKLFGMVGFPPFMANQRTQIPEFDIWANEEIAPRLNKAAKILMESSAFKDADNSLKLDMAKKLVSNVKDDVLDTLDKGYYPNEARLNNMRREWSHLPSTYRDAAKKEAGIDTPDRDLSEMEITYLRSLLKGIQDLQKEVPNFPQ